MKKIKAVALVLIMILCGAAFARGMQVEAKANAVQEKLSGEVFRFHVLANSDSKEDQELKMKVKEAVVGYMVENQLWMQGMQRRRKHGRSATKKN